MQVVEPVFIESVAQIVASAATTLTSLAYRRATSPRKRRSESATSLHTASERASHDFSAVKLLRQIPNGMNNSQLQTFMARDEIQHLAELLICAKITNASSYRVVAIRDAFYDLYDNTFNTGDAQEPTDQRTSLGAHSDVIRLRRARHYREVFRDNLYAYFKEQCEALANVVRSNVENLDAAVAQSLQRLSLHSLETIEQYLSLLTNDARPSRTTIDAWRHRYAQAFSKQHAKLRLPNFNSRHRVHYESVFVPPTFIIESIEPPSSIRRSARRSRTIPLGEANDRLVIVGDPGAGKSTTTAVMGVGYAERGDRVPFFVRMREVDADHRGFSVVDAISQALKRTYQLELATEAIEELLLDGSAIIFFDGLDEVIDSDVRAKCASVIEQVANAYPFTSIVVTSRRIGYNLARLDSAVFSELYIAPFDEAQVEMYVRNWFAMDGRIEEFGQSDYEHKVSTFLEQSKTIRDLRSNPLMLAHICVLFENRTSIPQKRAEIYESCAHLLMEKWDLLRGVVEQSKYVKTMHRALAMVAYRELTDPACRNGMTVDALETMLSDYFLGSVTSSPIVADQLAEELIQVCRVRAWMFTYVGVDTRTGKQLYSFTHGSLREYFGAWHMKRIHDTPEELAAELTSRLADQSWEILFQICLIMVDDDTADGGSRVVQQMFSDLDELSPERRELVLSTLLNSVDVVPLSGGVVRKILAGGIDMFAMRSDRSVLRLLTDGFGEHRYTREQFPATLTASVDRLSDVGLVDDLARYGWMVAHVDYLYDELRELDVPARAASRLVRAADQQSGNALASVAHDLLGAEHPKPNWTTTCLYAGVLPFAKYVYGINEHPSGLRGANDYVLSALFDETHRPIRGFGPRCPARWIVDSIGGPRIGGRARETAWSVLSDVRRLIDADVDAAWAQYSSSIYTVRSKEGDRLCRSIEAFLIRSRSGEIDVREAALLLVLALCDVQRLVGSPLVFQGPNMQAVLSGSENLMNVGQAVHEVVVEWARGRLLIWEVRDEEGTGPVS